MTDSISGVPRIQPAYPVKPVQPATKDREAGGRKKRERDQQGGDQSDREQKTTIDELV